MIHVPYHSYESVIRLFETAAHDPNVTHIKIVQYRVAKKSRIMKIIASGPQEKYSSIWLTSQMVLKIVSIFSSLNLPFNKGTLRCSLVKK